MPRARLLPFAMMLIGGFSVLMIGRANADIVVTLQGVTFADDGTASGSFTLNVYGYPAAADITTTPGISMNGQPLTGYTYTLAGNLVPSSPGPFDSEFIFYSVPAYFSLVLSLAQPIVDGINGFDPLLTGSGSGNTLAGSYENCVQNAVVCGGASYLDGRLITPGLLYAPEPGTVSLFGMWIAVMAAVRRLRTRVPRGAACLRRREAAEQRDRLLGPTAGRVVHMTRAVGHRHGARGGIAKGLSVAGRFIAPVV